MDVLPRTRDAARAAGVTRYFTGVACSRGHMAARFACNGACIACREHKRPPKPRPEDYSRLPAAKGLAARVGSPLYFTGQPCRRGHVAPRRVPSGNCVECQWHGPPSYLCEPVPDLGALKNA